GPVTPGGERVLAALPGVRRGHPARLFRRAPRRIRDQRWCRGPTPDCARCRGSRAPAACVALGPARGGWACCRLRPQGQAVRRALCIAARLQPLPRACPGAGVYDDRRCCTFGVRGPYRTAAGTGVAPAATAAEGG